MAAIGADHLAALLPGVRFDGSADVADAGTRADDGETPLETALSEGREIGYAGFELGNKFPKDGPGLKAKLDEFAAYTQAQAA